MFAALDLRYGLPADAQAWYTMVSKIGPQLIPIWAQKHTMNKRDGCSLFAAPPDIDLLLLPASFQLQQGCIRRPGQHRLDRMIYGIGYGFCAQHDAHRRPPGAITQQDP